MPVPHADAIAVSHVAATESPAGHAVVVFGWLLSRKPCGPSFMFVGGMPRRAFAAMLPTYAHEAEVLHWQHGPVGGPCNIASFSSCVMLPSSAVARESGVAVLSDQGPDTNVAETVEKVKRNVFMGANVAGSREFVEATVDGALLNFAGRALSPRAYELQQLRLPK